ncbi:hypothetical protein DEU56DRAFT_812079 [Suillus clintonianus]|uniref:uncharacterized protein n=1 Tax=Suillus clintonianus TaxID=1904413 RepID=UPI001B85D34B|nr:uncharacterized protein DEU56DRAFT_812079 [Suillus clintonianus]KAG2132795.1 hypothetical protein DEU56DRAFT_812079 [Suillus clintonianus]
MWPPLCTQCIAAAYGLPAYWYAVLQGVLQEVTFQYDVSPPVKHSWEGEEDIWMAEDLARVMVVPVHFLIFFWFCASSAYWFSSPNICSSFPLIIPISNS